MTIVLRLTWFQISLLQNRKPFCSSPKNCDSVKKMDVNINNSVYFECKKLKTKKGSLQKGGGPTSLKGYSTVFSY